MALQKGQRLREVGQFEVAEVGQIKSAGDSVVHADSEHRPRPPGGCAVVLLAALSRRSCGRPHVCRMAYVASSAGRC
ncbi:hypothetical protein C9397_11865 [Xanthomonas vasicola pv. vasculorum]|uniref:Uncharacterized protein n=1 Tax=Xanthomonas vasicola pv. vasculorum TaxID=325776 RepID=A0AAE8F599_XANVA|nr:hypothetical protein C7V42_02330 [Xanthomonas vasicola pv. vasculorum]TWQ16076.1 hypothetical protein FQK00_02375 [Xanthomonas vasicola]AZM69854.1 hypothetical protein CXP37_02340 [Xanthomonas vasicola pv. vasculorum]OWF57597.1 hypothetical protein B1H41_21010 [Xanthomonas vasicola pv. vasculorum]PUE68041.1 hypothetical protein C7Y63_21345 [Xanthomonas vasicola pv. vasculorum]